MKACPGWRNRVERMKRVNNLQSLFSNSLITHLPITDD